MTKLIETKLPSGAKILVQALDDAETPPETPTDPARQPGGVPAGDGVIEKRQDQLEAAIGVAGEISQSVETQLLDKPGHLSKVTLELGLSFTAKGGIVWVANGEASANLKVALEWDLSKSKPAP